MELASEVRSKSDAFETSGGSPPPQSEIPPQLAEELAEIIADALVADYEADALKTCAATPSPAGGSPASNPGSTV